MYFVNREDAGNRLCPLLDKYKGHPVVVYAIPRGGVTVAEPIARYLNAPMDILLSHKIGHPYHREYAIAAVSENGHMLGNRYELEALGEEWVEKQKEHQIQELKRKREHFMKGRGKTDLKGKIAIIVDDGIATGLTMKAGILELKEQHPAKIVVAVPVAPSSTAGELAEMTDEFIGLVVPDEGQFIGSVGSYYHDFTQVEDEEVIEVLERCAAVSGKGEKGKL